MQALERRRILVVIGGGIAAYKALELIRRLKERGAEVRAVLTKAVGTRGFVTELSRLRPSPAPAFLPTFSTRRTSTMSAIPAWRANPT